MNRPFHRSAGFTLIEIVIAVVIFSIIMTALFATFRAFLQTSEQVKQTLAQTDQFRPVFNRISQDLESIFILQQPRYKKPGFDSDPDPYRLTGYEQTLAQGTVSFLFFASAAHAALNGGAGAGIARVMYYIKDNDNDRYDLYRSDTFKPFSDSPGACSDPILCRDILGFDITYYNAENESYSSWDTEDENSSYTFPARIGFTITHGKSENPETYEFSVALLTQREPIE